MSFILDASVAACWAFRDEGHATADLALTRFHTEAAVVPGLWWFEVRNILVVNERRKRITERDTAAFLRDLSLLPIRMDQSPDEGGILRLARTHRLSVYDACYLELALREGAPLATLDRELAGAALAEQAKLLGEGC